MINSWYDKFLKLSNNYKEEIKKIMNQDEESSKICNHIVYNWTGRYLKLFRVKKLKSKKKNKQDKIQNLNPIENSEITFEYIDIIPNGKIFFINKNQKR